MRTQPLLTADRWIRALLDPKFEVQVIERGYPVHMRFPQGWHAVSNTDVDHLFYFVAAGGFSAQTDGRDISMKQGDLLWLAPGMPFRFWLPEGNSLTAYRVRLLTKFGKSTQPRCQLFKGAWSCQPWLEHLADEMSHSAILAEQRMRGLLLCFFTELARIEGISSGEQAGFTRAQRQTILEYFVAHVRDWPGSAELASHLQLSAAYFARQFRKTFGQPPRHWLMEQRVRLAASRLLESELNVSQVAEEFGYENLFLFSRQFKQVLGVSPQQYRRQRSVAT